MAERWPEVDRPRACAARRGAAPAATAEELAGVGGRWLAAAWSTNESVRTTRSPQLGLRWPKDGWPWSFGGDGHGGRGRTQQQSEREGEWRGERGMGQPTRSVEGAEARQRGRARGSGGGALLVHGRHAQATRRPLGRFREHLAGDGVAGVESGLGQIWADLDLGPKTKFEARELLYIFHLETKVIRALQQRVIRPQTVSVSALISVTEIHFRKSKLGQT